MGVRKGEGVLDGGGAGDLAGSRAAKSRLNMTANRRMNGAEPRVLCLNLEDILVKKKKCMLR